jgi:hypothetical protein
MRYEDYHEAFRAAVLLARKLGREVGLEKSPKGYYKKDGYLVIHLPKPENRYGHELRCQVVRPDEPL